MHWTTERMIDSRVTPVIHYQDHPGGRSGRYRTSN